MSTSEFTIALISAVVTMFTIGIPALFTYLGNRQSNKLTSDKDRRDSAAMLEDRLLIRIKDLEDRLTAVETERYKLILENALLLGKVSRLEDDNKDMQTHIEMLELEIKELRDKQV
jgi:chromosome segregation ATPase